MSFENAAGAVGINSSAAEMALWVRMLLECAGENEASEGRTCVLEAESIQRMWSPQTIITTRKLPGALAALESDFAAYGLGFRVQDSRGRKVVGHGGGLPGYVSRVTLVPEERLGVVVLTNQESGAAFNAVTQLVLDAYLGAPDPPVHWLEAFVGLTEAQAKKAEAQVAEDLAARDAESSPSLALAAYAGAYRDPWYGEVAIVEEGGRLVLNMTRTPRMLAELEHWQHDTFVARWREVWMSDHSPYDVYVTFALGPDGAVERMTMKPVSSAIDFSFDFQDLLFTPVRNETDAPAEN
jgi:hypothetical protein